MLTANPAKLLDWNSRKARGEKGADEDLFY